MSESDYRAFFILQPSDKFSMNKRPCNLHGLIFLLALLLAPSHSSAHGGGLIKRGPLTGCHENRGRGEFHCHSKSSFNRKSFSSKSAALAFVNEGKNASTNPSSGLQIYSRSSWEHWIDSDGDCKNRRHEILEERSSVPVTFHKSNPCLVSQGSWKDFYFNETLTKANQIDIDHVVALKHAHETGGALWDKKRKEEFANDKENLVITNLTYNRQKGAQTIETWLPIKRAYACRYVAKWFKIKEKYGLRILEGEVKTRNSLECERSL